MEDGEVLRGSSDGGQMSPRDSWKRERSPFPSCVTNMQQKLELGTDFTRSLLLQQVPGVPAFRVILGLCALIPP